MVFTRQSRAKIGVFTVSRKLEHNVSHSTAVLQTSFAGHRQSLTWPPRLHCVRLTDRRLQPTCHFGALDLVVGFHKLGWKPPSSLFCFDLRLRASDFGVCGVAMDNLVKPDEKNGSGSCRTDVAVAPPKGSPGVFGFAREFWRPLWYSLWHVDVKWTRWKAQVEVSPRHSNQECPCSPLMRTMPVQSGVEKKKNVKSSLTARLQEDGTRRPHPPSRLPCGTHGAPQGLSSASLPKQVAASLGDNMSGILATSKGWARDYHLGGNYYSY